MEWRPENAAGNEGRKRKRGAGDQESGRTGDQRRGEDPGAQETTRGAETRRQKKRDHHRMISLWYALYVRLMRRDITGGDV